LFYAEIDAANKAQQASNRIVAEEAAREQNKDRVAPNYTPEEIQRMVAEASPTQEAFSPPIEALDILGILDTGSKR